MLDDINDLIDDVSDLVNDPAGKSAVHDGQTICDREARKYSFEKGCACCYVHIRSWKVLIGGGDPQDFSIVEFVIFEKEPCRGKSRGPWLSKPPKSGQFDINTNSSYEIGY